jgi:hypothetical protein
MSKFSSDYEDAGTCEDCGGELVRHISTENIFHADPQNSRDCDSYE